MRSKAALDYCCFEDWHTYRAGSINRCVSLLWNLSFIIPIRSYAPTTPSIPRWLCTSRAQKPKLSRTLLAVEQNERSRLITADPLLCLGGERAAACLSERAADDIEQSRDYTDSRPPRYLTLIKRDVSVQVMTVSELRAQLRKSNRRPGVGTPISSLY